MEDRLSADQRAAIERPIAEAHGLPAEAYTSPDWARVERDSVLADGWTALLFADQVAPRHAVPVELLGLPLVAVADGDGRVRVFHNVCRHRGHRLVAEASPLKAAASPAPIIGGRTPSMGR